MASKSVAPRLSVLDPIEVGGEQEVADALRAMREKARLLVQALTGVRTRDCDTRDQLIGVFDLALKLEGDLVALAAETRGILPEAWRTSTSI